ncbi:MAG: L-threonylcarbamoyladenylate synthase [Chloroflexota bacterium]
MDTQIISISSPDALIFARLQLDSSDVIAAPTDTVYGLMCHYDNPVAIDKLYVIKERPPERAIPVLIGDIHQIENLIAGELSPLALELIEHLWPGALTLVLPAADTLPSELTAGQPTIAIRMPNHPKLVQLLRETGPLAATSANLSGHPDALSARQVKEQLDGRLSLVLDDGPSPGGQSSTIVAIPPNPNEIPTILRSGPLVQEVNNLLRSFQ